MASGPFPHNSELVDLTCNSVWLAEHNESCLFYSFAYLPAITDDMVPQVLQKSVRTCFPEVSSRGQSPIPSLQSIREPRLHLRSLEDCFPKSDIYNVVFSGSNGKGQYGACLGA